MILVLRILVAVIFLQTLFFKFTGAPESIYIFETLGVEPFGRYVSGIFEAIAAILLLYPSTVAHGAVLAISMMIPAIASHLLFLGIVIEGDGGLLFSMGVFCLLASSIILKYTFKNLPLDKLPVMNRYFANKS